MHLDIICIPAVAQEYGQLYVFCGPARMVIVAWWSICPSRAYECSQIPSCICLEWTWKSFHVGLGHQPMHLDIICRPAVTHEFGQVPKFWANKNGSSGMMVDPSAHPQHMNDLNHLIYLAWMCEPFCVGLGPQPMHLDIICRSFVTQEFGKNPKYLANKNDGNGLMIWMFSATLYVFGVDMGILPCGSGASANKFYSFVTHELASSLNSGQTNMVAVAWWSIHLLIQSI